MKRTLLVVLTIAILLFAFAGTASAFTATPEMQDAVGKMRGLGIMEGYPDGTMGPERNITRAEFAKMAVITAGLEGSAQMLVGTPSRFSDVQTNAWYTGWINLAEARGFVKGYPDGTFQPSGNITYSEVITVLLRILGYNDNLLGTWPVNYLAKATQLGITDDVAAFNASAPAIRGNVAILAGATLNENVAEWVADSQLFRDKAPVRKFIEDSFGSGAFSYEGDQYVTSWGFDGERFYVDVYDFVTATPATYTFAKTYSLAKAPGMPALQDQFVDLIFNKDGHVTYAENMNYGRVQFTGSDVTTAGQGDRTAFTVAAGKITVDNKTYTLAAGAVNAANTTLAPASGVAQGVRLAKNKDGNIAAVRGLNTPAMHVLVDSVSAVPRLTAKTGSAQGGIAAQLATMNADIRDEDTNWAVYKGGLPIAFSALAENDMVRIRPNANGYDWLLEVFPAKATGTLQEVKYDTAGNPSKVVVGGTEYDLATSPGLRTKVSDDDGETFANATAANMKDLLGANVTIYMSGFGGVEYVVTDEAGTSAYIWGVIEDVDYVVTWVGVAATQAGINSVEIINAAGQAVTYYTDSKSEIDGVDARTGVGPVIAAIGAADLVQFTLNADGKIKNLYTAAGAKDVAALTFIGANTDLNTVDEATAGWRNVTANTVIWGKDTAGDWVVSNAKELVDFVASAGDGGEGQLDNNTVKYYATNSVLTTTADYAIVVAKGENVDGLYMDLNIKGTVKRYNADAAGVFAAAVLYDMVAYNTSANDLTAVTQVVYDDGVSTATVNKVNYAANAVQIGATWFFLDADTVIYDLTDVSKKVVRYVGLDGVHEGDNVLLPFAFGVATGVADRMADADNILRYLIIKN